MARPAPIPNIDLGATFAVIDDSVDPPRWKPLAGAYATDVHAQRLIREHQLAGIWLLDDLGYRRYVTREP